MEAAPMRRLFAVVDSALVGIAVMTATADTHWCAPATIGAFALTYWALYARNSTIQTPSEPREAAADAPQTAPERPIVHDTGEHAGSPSAGLWHAFKWILAVGILATSMGRHGRVGAGPIAMASWLLRKRRKKGT
jgi:hypothetical protein